MNIEYKYPVTFQLIDSDAVFTDSGHYVILKNGKIVLLLHPAFCFDVWASSRSEALRKANKKLKGTLGIVSSTVAEDYKVSRSK